MQIYLVMCHRVMLASCIWIRLGCLRPLSSGISTSPWPMRWRSSGSGTQRLPAPPSPPTPWPTWPVWVWSTSATTPSSIPVSTSRWPSLSGGIRPVSNNVCKMPFFTGDSRRRFPPDDELSTNYDITRVAEEVTYSDASSGSLVYCAPVNGREIWRRAMIYLYSFHFSGQPSANITTGWA